jgi:hypothetical protein
VSSTDDDACDGPRRKRRSNGERGFWISGKEMEGVIWASFLGAKVLSCSAVFWSI